jgi:hypothetical protein
LAAAAACAVVGTALPLWTLSFQSNQYPDPLVMVIYADHLAGQKTANRDDLVEINGLNHYIGMRPLSEHDFAEFGWLPLAIVALALLALRTAALGTLRDAVDAAVLGLLFSGFSLYTFIHRLWEYGHVLSPEAAIKVAPFTPPFFGRVRIANFWVESYPGFGSLAVMASVALIVAALAFGVWRARRGSSSPSAVQAAA